MVMLVANMTMSIVIGVFPDNNDKVRLYNGQMASSNV